MTPELLIWAVIGSTTVAIHEILVDRKKRSGWDYFLHVGFHSLVLYIGASLMSAAWSEVGTLSPILEKAFPYEGADRFFFGILLSLVWGPVSAILWFKNIKPYLERNLPSSWGRRSGTEFSDVSFYYLHIWKKKKVMVTLSTHKVYIGMLIGASQDPSETKRFLILLPYMSGYRHPERLTTTVTTYYPEPSKDKQKDLMISMDAVTSITPFDNELNKEFQQQGVLTYVKKNIVA